jgi:hypothetical protein
LNDATTGGGVVVAKHGFGTGEALSSEGAGFGHSTIVHQHYK